MYFFFFKQKTAYEMRISDWSSDVCSSDLLTFSKTRRVSCPKSLFARRNPEKGDMLTIKASDALAEALNVDVKSFVNCILPILYVSLDRSEEHTSELQSLMRISYAVFCLKKKKNKQTTTNKNKNYHNTEII